MNPNPSSKAELVSDISTAIKSQAAEKLELLLAAGVSPNLWPDGANDFSLLREDWAVVDCHHSALQFERDPDGWYPSLRQASAISFLYGPEIREEQTKMMTALLKHGADMYAVFRQPLCRADPNTRSVFPGERQPASFTGTTHSYTLAPAESWPCRRAKKEDVWIYPSYVQPLPLFPGMSQPEVIGTSNPWILGSDNRWVPWVDNYEEGDEEDDEKDDLPIQYGLRSVIHSILEDGFFFQPILDLVANGTISLDLENRSPEGCTLLLSACQSKLGADAKLEGTLNDVSARLHYPFPPPQVYESSDKGNIVGTILHALLSLGADPLVTDYHGRNALHHLLSTTDVWTSVGLHRAPIIRSSLNFLASTFPALLNQPDHSGTYPLHAALRLLRRYPYGSRWRKLAGPEECLLDLISLKGLNADRVVDVSAHDGKGNTALHYVADEGLLEVRRGQASRQLFRAFLDHPDIKDNKEFINARNVEGKTALELILDDNGSMAEERRHFYYMDKFGLRDASEIDTEVLGWLDNAGADWQARNDQGKTLLHVIACHAADKAGWRCQYLLGKGVNPSACDMEGKTALDIAITYDNHDVVKLLSV